MALYEVKKNAISIVPTTSFGEVQVRERADLQRLLRSNLGVICPDTLLLAEEFSSWDDSRRRIDLLGLDKLANLVVIELKRSEDGGHMDLQAIRYAAMVSTMTFEQAVEAHASHLSALGLAGDSRKSILDFLGWDDVKPDEFGQSVRIMLVSAEFSKELTTAVLWLNRSDLDIQCVRMKPYVLDGRLLIDVQPVIPLPEAREYTVRLSQKERQERVAREVERDYTRFDVVLDGVHNSGLTKRRVMLELVHHLIVRRGNAPEAIAEAIPKQRERLLRSVEGVLDRSAFIERVTNELKAQGKGFDPTRYFCDDDELVHVEGRTYAMTNQWGATTRETIEALLAKFGSDGIEIRPVSES